MSSEKVTHFDGDRFKTGYIDESGDNGKNGSKCLVLTYICLDDKKRTTKIINKTRTLLQRSKNGERWLNRNGGEIKFSGFPDKHVLLKTIEELAKLRFQIQFTAVYKDGKSIHPSAKVNILYDLLDFIPDIKKAPCKIIADKDYFNNKKITSLAIKDYEETIYEKGTKSFSYRTFVIEDDTKFDKGEFNMLISIRHENSKNSPGLQVADLICGAIFQEMEHGDKEYTNIIRKHIQIQGRIIKPNEQK